LGTSFWTSGINTLVQLVELNEKIVNTLCKVVHFSLKLLYVTMRFIILRLLRVISAVELIKVLVISETNFFINVLYDLVHILAFADLAENVALKLKHWFLDYVVIEIDHIL